MPKASKQVTEVAIESLQVGITSVWVRGLTPFICNAMSEKVRQELLYPKGRKSMAGKQQSIKHDPLLEFRGSAYRSLDVNKEPTRIVFPATGFKSAICNAALETPGTKKAQIGRLLWVEGSYLSLYGVPQMLMSVVRSADMNRTPDVRTRAILPEWACQVTIKFTTPQLNAKSVIALLGRAGILIGVGDFRQGKGRGNYGQFEVCNASDCAAIVKAGGIKAQDAAFESPTFFDSETESLFTWYEEERVRRGQEREAAG